MSALALQESRERRETKLQVEIESGAVSLWVEPWRYMSISLVSWSGVWTLDSQFSRNRVRYWSPLSENMIW